MITQTMLLEEFFRYELFVAELALETLLVLLGR